MYYLLLKGFSANDPPLPNKMAGNTETVQSVETKESYFDTHQNPLALQELRNAYKELAEETKSKKVPDDEIVTRATENKLRTLYPEGYPSDLFDKEVVRMRTQLEIAHRNREEKKQIKEGEIGSPTPPAPQTGYIPKRPVTNWMQEWENSRT